MKKPQYITIVLAFIALAFLWAFGKTKPSSEAALHEGHQHDSARQSSASQILNSSFSIDSALAVAKSKLPTSEASALSSMEQNLKSAPKPEEKIHAFHQLAKYWKDSLKAFVPYAWYVAEGARLENSEKNLNFAGHLFLNNLQHIESGEMSKWMALQAKDLFERTLKLNAANDSAKVGLGATYMFGGISAAPMEGIAKIREVVDKDSTNVYAQMTLAMGSLMSGQMDKAQNRLESVVKLNPNNLQALLLLADVFEKQGKKPEAIKYYQAALPLAKEHVEMQVELKKRIDALKKQH